MRLAKCFKYKEQNIPIPIVSIKPTKQNPPNQFYITKSKETKSILSKSCDFSGTEHPLDLRPVCKLKFVCCSPGEKKTRAFYLSRLKRGGPMKFENTFFQIAKLRFSSIFVDFRQISRIFKKFSGDQFKS